MKHTFKQRVLVTIAVLLAGAICGMVVSSLITTALALKLAQYRLRQDATQLIAAHTAFRDEAYTLLTAMNASPYPFCSDAEIAWFRKLVFNAEYYRDAGRIRDGKIVCSAALGRDNLPQTRHFPAVSLADGMGLLNHFSPYDPGEQRVSACQIGDSYVDLDPGASKRLDLITRNRSLTVIDAVTHKPTHPGRPLPAAERVPTASEWDGRVGQILYATRCDSRNLTCMTAYVTIPEALSAHRSILIFCVALGGLIGALFGCGWAFFNLREKSLELQLRHAILKDHLRVVYQPIVDVVSGRIVGAEALARWSDENGSPALPEVFIRLAEERGFVGAITKGVLRRALRDFAPLLAAHPDFRLSVNVAAADLSDPLFLPLLEQSLAREAVLARSLTIEITENSTARHEVAMETIRKLRQRGHAVHIDDFGTGYSSLAYLRDLAIDAIKIDRSFTQSIGTQAVTLGILPQILAMAQALNLSVIAEGVETRAQADYFAAAQQPILAQGWLFGPPVTIELFLLRMAKAQTNASPSSDAA